MSGADISRAVKRAMGVIEELSEVLGPRAPGSPSERAAADLFAESVRGLGGEVRVEEFSASRSFGPVHGATFLAAVAAGVVPSRRVGIRRLLAVGAAAAGAWEGAFRSWGPLERLRSRTSQNVIGYFGPDDGSGEAGPTVCLVSHLDSSRSGVMFHPRVVGRLGDVVGVVRLAMLMQAALELAPISLRSSGVICRLALISRCILAAALCLIAERELRGVDVPGANDNASGVGACLGLVGLVSLHGVESVRVVVLATGAEEAGVLGMRRFLASHDTSDWIFLNFDGVGADARLRYLTKEGGRFASHRATVELVELLGSVSRQERLDALPLEQGSGLPYDATAVLAQGGRAVTITAQDGPIPDYHWPTDRLEAISVQSVERAIRLGWAALQAINEGWPSQARGPSGGPS